MSGLTWAVSQRKTSPSLLLKSLPITTLSVLGDLGQNLTTLRLHNEHLTTNKFPCLPVGPYPRAAAPSSTNLQLVVISFLEAVISKAPLSPTRHPLLKQKQATCIRINDWT